VQIDSPTFGLRSAAEQTGAEQAGADQSTDVSMKTGVWSEGFSPLRA